MQAGTYIGLETLSVEQRKIPSPGKGEALIKIAYAGICGTDMMIYQGKHPRAKAPLIMGHEFSGTIEALGSESCFSKGDKVVIEPTLSCGTCKACEAGQHQVCKYLKLIGIDMDGGFASFAVVPINKLIKAPDVELSHAALTEPLAVAVHTIKRSGLQIGNTIIILGGGPIGLLIGLVAKQAGAGEVLISDISPYRLSKAKELGFTAIDARTESVAEIVNAKTDGKMADIVFEVAGNQITANQMTELVRIQGKIMVVSVYKQAPAVDLAIMHFKELSILTTRCYSKDDFKTAIKLITNKQVNVEPLISHKLPLSRLEEGFKFMQNPEAALKILFYPEEDTDV
ncbi:zinc-dependent alcohol dehydrogenase [Terribacillus saccharophilus]|uniref:zinc-dependent alcohol dehydrogenase n=1 Tax=Terribacillus saccharophilus TaxID=361277 RepID=UPI00398251D8